MSRSLDEPLSHLAGRRRRRNLLQPASQPRRYDLRLIQTQQKRHNERTDVPVSEEVNQDFALSGNGARMDPEPIQTEARSFTTPKLAPDLGSLIELGVN